MLYWWLITSSTIQFTNSTILILYGFIFMVLIFHGNNKIIIMKFLSMFSLFCVIYLFFSLIRPLPVFSLLSYCKLKDSRDRQRKTNWKRFRSYSRETWLGASSEMSTTRNRMCTATLSNLIRHCIFPFLCKEKLTPSWWRLMTYYR